MTQKSVYPRVVLIKSFNPDCSQHLKSQLGRYTHIQSYNGVLLDGLDINEVSAIIQSSSHLNKIQLVVRYIHPVTTATSSLGLVQDIPGVGTPITPASVDPIKETLPIQLVILGNVLKQCKELFKHFSTPPTDLNRSSAYSSNSSHWKTEEGVMRSMSTPTHSTTSKTSELSFLRLPSQSNRSETSGSGCESYDSSDFNNDYMALARSDKYVERAFVPSFLFNSCPSSSAGVGSTLSSPGGASVRPPNSDKQYIVNMFTRHMDRRCVHLFLRQCGIYIVTFSCSAMHDDPQIQFENLLYWIRLVQGYVTPNGIKRIIVVGMKDIDMNTQEEHASLKCLRDAIQEADFSNLYMTKQKNPIIMFDPLNLQRSLGDLCGAITRCMDLMMGRAWHMDKPFYSSVFQPFSYLNEVLCYISCSQQITMSPDAMLTTYKNSDPNFFDTLAAYSTASISLTQNCKLGF